MASFIWSSQAPNTIFVTWVASLKLVNCFPISYVPIIMKHPKLICSMVLHPQVFTCLFSLSKSVNCDPFIPFVQKADILSEPYPSVKVILNTTFSLNTYIENSVFDPFFLRFLILTGFLDNFLLILLAFLLWSKIFFEWVKHPQVQNVKGMRKVVKMITHQAWLPTFIFCR